MKIFVICPFEPSALGSEVRPEAGEVSLKDQEWITYVMATGEREIEK
jgi:hypothetical protein